MNDLDPRALLRELGVDNATSIAPVTGGWDASIWRVECDGQTYALRAFGPGRAADCEREMLVMQAAGEGGIPVPHVHAHSLSPERSTILLSWVPGKPLLHEVIEKPQRLRELSLTFGRMQARIHELDAPAVLLARSSTWIEWAGPEEAELQSRLKALNLRRNALLHLDYNAMNVMVEGDSITAVLDWINARAGDPRADLARSHTMIVLSPRRPGINDDIVTAALDGWWRGYAEIAGDPGDMSLFYAWAGAVMMRDLRPKLGRPGIPLTEADFDRMRAWTDHWKAWTGLSA